MASWAAMGAGLLWLAALYWTWQRHRRAPEHPPRHLDLLAAGALVLATLAFFWRTVSGDVFQPADGGDLVSFLYPTYRFAAAALARGELPLWNPHLYGGAPFIADIQAGFLYLPNLLLFLLWPDFPYSTMQWLVLGHLAWAGVGMYVLARTLTWPDHPVSRLAALFAGLAFQFSDPFLTHLGNLNLVAVLSWLPWVFAAYLRGRQGNGWRWAAVAGLLFGLGNYAGHAQSSYYIGLALGIVALGFHWSGTDAWRPAALWRDGARLLLALLVAGLISAPILLPTLELAGYTARRDFTYQDTVAFSLAPTQLIGLVTPGFFGRGPALHWSLWDRVETPFTGVTTLLLAVAALMLAGAELRRRLWTWVGLGLFGLLVALGVYAVLHGWLTLLAPGFDQLRAPARSLVLWSLALALLAAVGLDRVRAHATAQPAAAQLAAWDAWCGLLAQGGRVWVMVVLPLAYLALLLTQQSDVQFLRASVAALALTLAALVWWGTWGAIAGAVAGWWSSRTAAALLVGLLFFDMSAAGAYTDISPDDPTRGFHHPEIVAHLRADSDRFRIDTATGIQDLWQPDTAALVGLEDVAGIVNPLMLRHWRAQTDATGGRHSAAYDLLNVKYVIVRDGTPLPDKFVLDLDAPGELAVYRNPDALPRAWVVHEAMIADDPDAALTLMQAPGFDPARTLLLLNGDTPRAAPFGAVISTLPPSQADVIEYTAASLSVRTNATGPGFLVLSEVWYPGWRATVNGVDIPVLRVNGGLRGVPVPGGEAIVRLIFAPDSWRAGLAGAGLGLLLTASLCARGVRLLRKRR